MRVDRSGFTLIEIVVVLTILGVVGAAVVPQMVLESRNGARASVREIVSAYRTARGLAAARGMPATVAVELNTGRYWVYVEPTATTSADTVRQGTVPLDGSSALRGGDGRWVVTGFDPFGRSRSERGSITVSTSKERYEIRADPWTAAVDVRRR